MMDREDDDDEDDCTWPSPDDHGQDFFTPDATFHPGPFPDDQLSTLHVVLEDRPTVNPRDTILAPATAPTPQFLDNQSVFESSTLPTHDTSRSTSANIRNQSFPL